MHCRIPRRERLWKNSNWIRYGYSAWCPEDGRKCESHCKHFTLQAAVDEKIEELLEKGIIEKVNEPSPWISPVVPVLKTDDIRICIDMRRANEAVLRENHPLPTMEAKLFTKLDIKNAFHQV